MTEVASKVTRKGQVTVPIEIRKALGIKVGDHVAFVLEDGAARLTRRRSVVEQTASMFKTDQPPCSAEELRDAAEQAIADEVMERSGG